MTEKKERRIVVYLKGSVGSMGLNLDENGRVKKSESSYELNDFFECALEEALKIKESFGGEVLALVIGEEKEEKILKDALALGADEAVRVWDDSMEGSDPLVHSKILSQAASKMNFDLILTGAEDDEDVCTHICPAVAQISGIQYANLVNHLELVDGKALVNRERDNGREEVLEIQLPAIFSVQAGINMPRYMSISGIRKAKKKAVIKWGLEDIGLNEEVVGASGSMTRTEKYYFPESLNKAEIIEGRPEDVAKRIRQILEGLEDH